MIYLFPEILLSSIDVPQTNHFLLWLYLNISFLGDFVYLLNKFVEN